MKINSVVFDTTAILLHGTIVYQESKTFLPNATITLTNKNKEYTALTDSSGEFEIFKNIQPGEWDILIPLDNYNCLIVKDIIKSGGHYTEKQKSKIIGIVLIY